MHSILALTQGMEALPALPGTEGKDPRPRDEKRSNRRQQLRNYCLCRYPIFVYCVLFTERRGLIRDEYSRGRVTLGTENTKISDRAGK